MAKRHVIARVQSPRSNLKARSLRSARGDGSSDFLLEIGCEELPADYLPGALDWDNPRSIGLSSVAHVVFLEKGIIWQKLQSFGTPRRLALIVSDMEPVIRKEEKGPPVSIAFDPQGQPTRAAEAFAQKHGLKVSQLTRRQTSKGEAVFAEYQMPVAAALAEAVPEMIQKIPFPKTMRWDSSGVRFARPVRSLLCLYGSQTIRTAFGETPTSNATWFGRAGAKKKILISSPAVYLTVLKRAGVTVEEGKTLQRVGQGGVCASMDSSKPKRAELLRKLTVAANDLGGRLPDQSTEEFEWLLDTVTFLAEDPVVQAGSFRAEYLDLSPEVLATAMAKHLKLFSVRERNSDRLLPKFLAILEGNSAKPVRVMGNIERILEARFTDARFFWKEDTKTKLAQKIPELAQVAFHEKLGSVKERSDHLYPLMAKVIEAVRFPGPLSVHARRAAELAKADLVTQMVREFPSLQGVIGGCYAAHDGEPAAVAEAIREQYRPRAAADAGPVTPLGAVLSLADRVDTLVGYFGVGLKPTGSVDPYSLRRQANGLVRILVEPPAALSFVGLSIDTLFEQGIQSWGRRISSDPAKLKAELTAFLRERFEALAFAGRRMNRDLIRAVLAADSGGDLAGAWERLGLLQGWWGQKKGLARQMLEKAAKVAERTGRMVRSVKDLDLPSSVDGAILREPVERELWDHWNRMAPQMSSELNRREYEAAVRTYSSLYPVVHSFFEKVFVMDEDLQVRRNRLALMRQIHQGLAARFADLSLLPLAGLEPKG